jgi:hypothetical protein
MVFIQPRILRDGNATSYETGQKYNYIRDQQRRFGPRGEVLPLLPGEKRQLLPELAPPPPRPATTPAPTAPGPGGSGTATPKPPGGAPAPSTGGAAAAPDAATASPPARAPGQ